MTQHPLIGAYQEIRFSQKKSFILPQPLSTISIPLDKVFFSYLNTALKNKTGRNVNYLFYQFEEIGNDSYGVHFEIDFEATIVEVTDISVIIWAEAPFYQTDITSTTIGQAIKFSDLNEKILNLGNINGLELITDSGANHTRKSGFGLTNIKYTIPVLLT